MAVVPVGWKLMGPPPAGDAGAQSITALGEFTSTFVIPGPIVIAAEPATTVPVALKDCAQARRGALDSAATTAIAETVSKF
jgi:hypothetical protein